MTVWLSSDQGRSSVQPEEDFLPPLRVIHHLRSHLWILFVVLYFFNVTENEDSDLLTSPATSLGAPYSDWSWPRSASGWVTFFVRALSFFVSAWKTFLKKKCQGLKNWASSLFGSNKLAQAQPWLFILSLRAPRALIYSCSFLVTLENFNHCGKVDPSLTWPKALSGFLENWAQALLSSCLKSEPEPELFCSFSNWRSA